jgi:hypothetical protein
VNIAGKAYTVGPFFLPLCVVVPVRHSKPMQIGFGRGQRLFGCLQSAAFDRVISVQHHATARALAHTRARTHARTHAVAHALTGTRTHAHMHHVMCRVHMVRTSARTNGYVIDGTN